MRKRLLIGLMVSIGVNLLIFAIIVAMALHNKIPLDEIFPIDFIKIEVEKPKPPPPPPKPKPKKDPPKIEPTKAPIEAEPDSKEVATIQSAPVIKDDPIPNIVNFTELDRPPKRLKFVKPPYPPIARRANKEGLVVVKFLITKSGNVTNVKVIKSPGGLGFADNAIAAVSQWKYETPTIKGHPVNAWCVVPIRFTLD